MFIYAYICIYSSGQPATAFGFTSGHPLPLCCCSFISGCDSLLLSLQRGIPAKSTRIRNIPKGAQPPLLVLLLISVCMFSLFVVVFDVNTHAA